MFRILRRMIVTWLFSDESTRLHIPSFVEHQNDQFVSGLVRLFFIDGAGWTSDRSRFYSESHTITHKSGISLWVYKDHMKLRHTAISREAGDAEIQLSDAQKSRVWEAYTRWEVERALMLTKSVDASYDAALSEERENIRQIGSQKTAGKKNTRAKRRTHDEYDDYDEMDH